MTLFTASYTMCIVSMRGIINISNYDLMSVCVFRLGGRVCVSSVTRLLIAVNKSRLERKMKRCLK